MMDPFIAERDSEERAQRELLKQRGFVIDNPDVNVVHTSGNSEVYKFAEMELLKLKTKLSYEREISELDRIKLASLIQTLIAKGGAS
jgi:hypothetical protein